MITKSFRMTAVAALLCGVSAMAVAAVTAGTYEGCRPGQAFNCQRLPSRSIRTAALLTLSLTFPAKP